MKAELKEYWRSRSPRDRRIIVLVAGVAALSVVYAYLWMPMNEARARLRSELPKLRGDAVQMNLQAQEIARLKAVPSSIAGRAASAETITASAEQFGIKNELSQTTALSNERIQILLNSVAFDRWVNWTKALATTNGLRVESAQITALGEPGTVKVQAVLTLPGR